MKWLLTSQKEEALLGWPSSNFSCFQKRFALSLHLRLICNHCLHLRSNFFVQRLDCLHGLEKTYQEKVTLLIQFWELLAHFQPAAADEGFNPNTFITQRLYMYAIFSLPHFVSPVQVALFH